jgi:hypothetical protein
LSRRDDATINARCRILGPSGDGWSFDVVGAGVAALTSASAGPAIAALGTAGLAAHRKGDAQALELPGNGIEHLRKAVPTTAMPSELGERGGALSAWRISLPRI